MTDRSTTERGFAIYDQFTDTYGNQITVQQSSAAHGPRVWIFAEAAGDRSPESAHLSLAQAQRLRDALDTFIRENQTGGESR